MSAKTLRKLSYSAVTVVMLSLLLVPTASAEDIVLDGVINESEYTLFLLDDTHAPIYSLYTASDADYIYIGIILMGDTDATNNNLMLAFKQSNIDYLIRVNEGGYDYWPSGGWLQGWWQPHREGLLPPGVNIIVGETSGETSYEVRILKSALGSYGENFPANFRFWLEIMGDVKGVDYNWYPESTKHWWFYKEDIEADFNGEENITPKFHVPEVPYGTALTLAAMAAALVMVSRKPSNKLKII